MSEQGSVAQLLNHLCVMHLGGVGDEMEVESSPQSHLLLAATTSTSVSGSCMLRALSAAPVRAAPGPMHEEGPILVPGIQDCFC